MATIEEFNLAQQAVKVVTNMTYHMRRNAQGAIADVQNGRRTVAQVIAMELANCSKYLSWFDAYDAFASDSTNVTKLTNGLAAIGITVSSIGQEFVALRNAAMTYQTALGDATTATKANAAVLALLASVPADASLLP